MVFDFRHSSAVALVLSFWILCFKILDFLFSSSMLNALVLFFLVIEVDSSG